MRIKLEHYTRFEKIEHVVWVRCNLRDCLEAISLSWWGDHLGNVCRRPTLSDSQVNLVLEKWMIATARSLPAVDNLFRLFAIFSIKVLLWEPLHRICSILFALFASLIAQSWNVSHHFPIDEPSDIGGWKCWIDITLHFESVASPAARAGATFVLPHNHRSALGFYCKCNRTFS